MALAHKRFFHNAHSTTLQLKCVCLCMKTRVVVLIIEKQTEKTNNAVCAYLLIIINELIAKMSTSCTCRHCKNLRSAGDTFDVLVVFVSVRSEHKPILGDNKNAIISPCICTRTQVFERV